MNSVSSPVRNNNANDANNEPVCPGAPARRPRVAPVVIVPPLFDNDDHMPPPVLRLNFDALMDNPVPDMEHLHINNQPVDGNYEPVAMQLSALLP